MGKEVIIIKDDPIHLWFGLTYANYLVMPRSILQSMPHEWQEKFVALLEQWEEELRRHKITLPYYAVQARGKKGRFIGDDLSDYQRGRRDVFDEAIRERGERE